MILPFLRLLQIPNTEAEPPGDAHDGIGKKVWGGLGVTCQLGRLDLRVYGGEAARLSSDGPAVLLFHRFASAKDNGLCALELVHGDLVELDL